MIEQVSESVQYNTIAPTVKVVAPKPLKPQRKPRSIFTDYALEITTADTVGSDSSVEELFHIMKNTTLLPSADVAHHHITSDFFYPYPKSPVARITRNPIVVNASFEGTR
jgi:hypothetical protein